MTTPDDSTIPEPAAPPAPAMDASPAAPMAPPPMAPPPAAPAQYAPTGYATPPQPAYAAPESKPNTWMNIVSFVTALLGMAIVPIIFGHLGVSASNKGKADLKGLGIAGLIIGYLEVVFWLLIIALIIGGTIAANNT